MGSIHVLPYASCCRYPLARNPGLPHSLCKDLAVCHWRALPVISKQGAPHSGKSAVNRAPTPPPLPVFAETVPQGEEIMNHSPKVLVNQQ